MIDRKVLQLFTDPENQPTQYGTVTLEYVQREIAAEREACARVCDERAIGWKDVNFPRNDTYAAMHTAAKNEARALAEAIRARG